MGKILCATRGGEASYRTQDAVIERAKREDATILFLYVVDVEFLRQASRAVRPDVVRHEMEGMGNFLLTMACERATKEGVAASWVLKHSSLSEALLEVAKEENITLIALGQPAGSESVFQLAELQQFARKLEQETGIPTEII